ncbi:hypothetical protein HCN44_010310 [Aphidius gifuensis]|uniref:28S ribosomal protein S27, mitochondrial n=1 Tax=Aphidius gifuensis TaxID=684658 RepID=A0A834XWX2_APHGI|nr:uncharacterized protein LOC122851874 [Aphidius gifuensis]KAF7993715.1 hypothetical protein HCN44_010310 [Aphidius gifuensis]
MWNSVKSSSRCLLRIHKCRRFERTFLSESYPCTDAWNRRLESPLLSKINPSDMFLELDQRFNKSGLASAIDVDIFANTLKDPERVDELIDILHRLRNSTEATNILESTQHAVIRYFLEINDKKTLLEVLNDRLNYGIFPDHFTYNVLMNQFIKEKDFVSATKIGSLLMLQEDADHKLTNELSVYSCLQYLENIDSWTLPPPPPVNPKEEVVKVRVGYLRNPYFDDHFDIREPKEIAGKTLVFFSKNSNDTLGRSCHLGGLILWKKYDKAAELAKSYIDAGVKDVIYTKMLNIVDKELQDIPEDKITDEVKSLKTILEKLRQVGLKEGCYLEEQEERVKKAVKDHEENDIKKQLQCYEEWDKERMDLLHKQIEDLDKKRRLENVEKTKKEIQTEERLLNFFDKEEEIELEIEKKLQWEEETYGPILEVKEDLENNYIPPEITKKSRVQ